MNKQLPTKGQRIELVSMSDDPAPVEVGSVGTVQYIQVLMDTTLISVDWDNGRSLSLIAEVDEWKVLCEAQEV
jgi:hypothetical protein